MNSAELGGIGIDPAVECGSRSVGLFGGYLQTKDHIVIVLAYVCQEFVDLYGNIVVFSLVVGINTRKDLSLIKIFLPKICITFGDLWFCIFVTLPF